MAAFMMHRRFVIVVGVASLALVACKKKTADAPPPSSGSATGSAAPSSGGSAATPAPAPSGGGGVAGADNALQVKHSVPEFSGTYAVALAKLEADATIVAFVRDCPQLTCEVGAWEPEQVAHVCPKAFIATARVPKTETGKYRVDLTFAGPASNPSTATIEGTQVQFTRIDHDEVDGSISLDNTDSSAHATFKAPACPIN